MKKKTLEDEVVESSGNIYADLNYKNPKESQTKASLAAEIYLIIKRKKLTQKKAAELLGLTQPKISNLVNGRLSGFSVERLMSYLNVLDFDIEISLREKPKNRKKAQTYVSSEHHQPVAISAKKR